MHGIDFLRDLAIIMLVAGLVTIIFHRLKQPVVLGYIIAGLIIGPYTPPAQLISDKHTIEILAEVGVVLLMFGLGLHFSLKDLSRVGATAVVAASLEIVTLLAAGFGLGQLFGWSKMDSIFLGAIIAISSTTIIIKALGELGLTREKFAGVIFGVLIVEDILAIAILALLSGVALTGDIGVTEVFTTLAKLGVFLAAILVVGLLAIPRLLRYVDRFKSNEMLLITALAICFGFSLLAALMEYSVALGAFIAGAVVAEAREKGKIERLIEPVKDTFSALFFVAIGMMIQPKLLVDYVGPIVLITIVVVLGKILTCSLGAFVTGYPARTSMKVGMGLAQIGEFSFIIATLGLSLGVISEFLYPIAVTVSAITTFLTPYLIRSSDGVVDALARITPHRFIEISRSYTQRFREKGQGQGATPGKAIRQALRRVLLQVLLNMALVTAIFISATFAVLHAEKWVQELPEWIGSVRGIVWFVAAVAAMPLLIVTVLKIRAVTMLLAELWVAPGSYTSSTGERSGQIMVARMLFITGIAVVAMWIVFLSVTMIPPWPVAMAMAVVLAGMVTFRWKSYASIYGKAQRAITAALAEEADRDPIEMANLQPIMQTVLTQAVLESVVIEPGTYGEGRLLRELELRARSGASAVAIERSGESIINPGPNEELQAEDTLLLLGSREQVNAGKELLLSTPSAAA